MSMLLDLAYLLLSSLTLWYALASKRKQAAISMEVSSLTEQVRAMAHAMDELGIGQPLDNSDLERVKRDLRTPVTSIVGFCAILKQTSPEFSPKQERMLDNIDTGARQMLELVSAGCDRDAFTHQR